MQSRKKIAIGLSGGVDSSVSAAILQQQGYDVTGVYLECWKAPGCRAEEDRKDALAVALQLGIPFVVLDFKQQYRDRVVEYFFDTYMAGQTPNPDVLCNKVIKFGLFYDWALEHGYDAIATGHYAKIVGSQLVCPNDEHKDQTYFLYRLRSEQLHRIFFPIEDLTKQEVRKLAGRLRLPTASKPDSQGICFIGEINVSNFLRERLGENPGDVVDTKGNIVGRHKGLWFYTIGQRHGFDHAFDLRNSSGINKHAIPPFYVLEKRKEENQLVVGFGPEAYKQSFNVNDLHWISDAEISSSQLLVRIRHTGKLLPCNLTDCVVRLQEPIQGIAAGQSAVFYQKREGQTVCLGGGIIQ